MQPLLVRLCIPAGMLACLALAGCGLGPSAARAPCSLGEGANANAQLTPGDCAQVQAIIAAQKTAQQEAATRAAETERQALSKYRVEVAARISKDEAHGYSTTSIDNFKLNGDDLARTDAKVAVPGVYLKTREGEFLLPSTLATSQVDMDRTPYEGVNLLSRSASRTAKSVFAQCQKDPVKARLGCPMTILGKAVLCERTTRFGRAEAPCIAVDDSWYIVPPS